MKVGPAPDMATHKPREVSKSTLVWKAGELLKPSAVLSYFFTCLCTLHILLIKIHSKKISFVPDMYIFLAISYKIKNRLKNTGFLFSVWLWSEEGDAWSCWVAGCHPALAGCHPLLPPLCQQPCIMSCQGWANNSPFDTCHRQLVCPRAFG